MNTCLVVACDIDRGFYHEIRGISHGFNVVDVPKVDMDETQDLMRDVYVWACHKDDAKAVAEKMSTKHVGSEIKIFNLSAIYTRAPGELKEKVVTTDGVFP